ncbi:hypothetical protein [Roseovarius sp. 2305UL8-3]|uniref:hypothetical protein n=1 Tax=Roseovarius conchicola TaxID=3121636 RepID=UPI003528F0A8
MKNLGVIFIALCVISLVMSFVMDVPRWVNLLGIVFGAAGLFFLGAGRKKGDGDGG